MATPSQPPSISLTLSLTPSTYTFTSPTPPTISLTLTSHSPNPITLFTWNTPLNPPSGLTQAAYPITDLTTVPPSPVPQNTIRVQRLPISRARGSSDEKYFITLYPNKPVTVSYGFSRGGGEGGRRPQPKHVVEKGKVVDEEGRETGARRSIKGTGVDGLENGKKYRVDVDREGLSRVWWRWGEKEEVLVDGGDTGWNLSEVQRGEGQVRWEVGQGVDFEVL